MTSVVDLQSGDARALFKRDLVSDEVMESVRSVSTGKATTAACAVLLTTTGSSQNHSLAAPAAPGVSCTRKRGIASLLDITNSQVTQARTASQQAKRSLQEQVTHNAPRGNPVLGAAKKHRSADSLEQHLPQLLGDKAMSSAIAETLLAYTQRNVSFEVQKAVAITVMTTAMSLWNCSVIDAGCSLLRV